ncbi:hypothetical protein E2C01_054026 [Portunus trituberculatus]|uniref:Uncharacterized protein n=1 Tax=Portunus trituberculatus TaxID=210409 RepID=A0A5B7GM14_PORTR|nr:hypothetical protein [Portunus trituberculatus]
MLRQWYVKEPAEPLRAHDTISVRQGGQADKVLGDRRVKDTRIPTPHHSGLRRVQEVVFGLSHCETHLHALTRHHINNKQHIFVTFLAVMMRGWWCMTLVAVLCTAAGEMTRYL